MWQMPRYLRDFKVKVNMVHGSLNISGKCLECGNISSDIIPTLYVGMTRTCLCRHTYEKLATAPTLHLLAFLGS